MALQDEGLKRFKHVIDADCNMRSKNSEIDMISREPKLSGDGRYFAFVSAEYVMKSVGNHSSRKVRVCYVNVSTCDGNIIYKDIGESMAWSPGGLLSYIQIVENILTLLIFDVDEKKLLGRLDKCLTVDMTTVITAGHAMDWSFDGRYIAYVNGKAGMCVLCVWSVVTEEGQLKIEDVALVRLNTGFHQHIHSACVAWSPCKLTLIISMIGFFGEYLYMADITDILRLNGHELKEHEPFRVIKSEGIILVKWSPDGRYILTSSGKIGTYHNYYQIFSMMDIHKGVPCFLKRGLSDSNNFSFGHLAWSSECNMIAFGFDDKFVIINVAEVLLTWNDRTNRLFYGPWRQMVFLLMCIHHRMEMWRKLPSDYGLVPALPLSIWLNILNILYPMMTAIPQARIVGSLWSKPIYHSLNKLYLDRQNY